MVIISINVNTLSCGGKNYNNSVVIWWLLW